jgi:hypothetical protein
LPGVIQVNPDAFFIVSPGIGGRAIASGELMSGWNNAGRFTPLPG